MSKEYKVRNFDR